MQPIAFSLSLSPRQSASAGRNHPRDNCKFIDLKCVCRVDVFFCACARVFSCPSLLMTIAATIARKELCRPMRARLGGGKRRVPRELCLPKEKERERDREVVEKG